MAILIDDDAWMIALEAEEGFQVSFHTQALRVMVSDYDRSPSRSYERQLSTAAEFVDWCDLNGFDRLAHSKFPSWFIKAKSDDDKVLMKLRWC